MPCRKPPTRAQYCAKSTVRKTRKRSRSSRKARGKSCRPGKVTRNPFFNFLRIFRKKHCGWTAVKVAVEGAKCWCQMSNEKRNKFYKEACKAPPFRHRSKSGGRKGRSRRAKSTRRTGRRRRSRSGSRRRKSSRSGSCGSRKKKARRGPIKRSTRKSSKSGSRSCGAGRKTRRAPKRKSRSGCP